MTTETAQSSLSFRLGEFGIHVRSDLHEVVADLARLYPRNGEPPKEGNRTIGIEVRAAPRTWTGRRRYDLVSNGETINRGLRRHEVLPHVEWGINWRLITSESGYVIIHAASMVRDGRGVVFAGSSGGGKSTLVAALLRRGWHYLCDEFALIHLETGHLHPFPKAICIKAGSFDLVRRLDLPLAGNRHYVKSLKGPVSYISPAETGAEIGEPGPIRSIVRVSYSGDPDPLLRRFTPGRAAFCLLHHTVNRDVLGTRAVEVIDQVVRNADCYLLDSGRIEETVELLEGVL